MDMLIKQVHTLAFELRSAKLPRIVGAMVKEQTDRRFETKQDPNGRAWNPWSGSYARTRKSMDSLLIDYSTHEGGPHLSDSITMEANEKRIIVGTAVEYGGANQETRPFLGLGAQNIGQIEARLIDVFKGWV